MSKTTKTRKYLADGTCVLTTVEYIEPSVGEKHVYGCPCRYYDYMEHGHDTSTFPKCKCKALLGKG